MTRSEERRGRPSRERRRVLAPSTTLLLCLPLLVLVTGCSLIGGSGTAAQYGSMDYDPGTGFLVPRGPWERFDGLLDEAGMLGATPTYVLALTRSPLFSERDGPTTDRSYRLRIAVPGPRAERSWILILPVTGSEVRVLVDGRGLPLGNHAVAWSSDASELSVIVQVPARTAGIDSSSLSPSILLFGEAGAVTRLLVIAGGLSFLVVGVFAITGILILLLFNLWRKNREFLAFAAFLLAGALGSYVNASALLPFGTVIFSDPDLQSALGFDLQLLALGWFFASLLRNRSRLPGWLTLVPVLALAAAELAWPEGLYLLHSIGQAYLALVCLLAFGFLAGYGIKGSTRALWFLPAPLCLLAILPLRIWLSDSPEAAFLIEPGATILFALVATNALLRKVGHSFRTTETLTGYVLDVSETVKRFIPQEFLDALEKKDVVDLRLGDHVKRDMTIFFSDIRAFTELSERLTVEENFAFINSYLSRVVPIIKENGGFIDKYIGDAIMALYPDDNGPDQAIRTAIAMQGKINEYNGHRAKMGYRSIQMGVGIHSGSLMLGVVGVENRMENTVISDAVNLGSRLQAITKAFNISLAISEQVFKSVEDPGAYTYRFIGKVKVKGKAAPISVFEIFDGIEPSLFERKVKANTFFEQGMLAYYQKDFSGAMYYFKRVLDSLPEDGASSFYLETCMNRSSL